MLARPFGGLRTSERFKVGLIPYVPKELISRMGRYRPKGIRPPIALLKIFVRLAIAPSITVAEPAVFWTAPPLPVPGPESANGRPPGLPPGDPIYAPLVYQALPQQ